MKLELNAYEAQLLLDLVRDAADDVSSGSTVYGDAAEQAAHLQIFRSLEERLAE